MKHCNITEYEEMGLNMDKYDREMLSQRICPNITEELKPYYKVKNRYNNNTERHNILIEVVRCEKEYDKSC